MKLGLGMYPSLLTADNYRFARQAGATHVVAHLPGFAQREGRDLPSDQMWTLEELAELKNSMNAEGLEFAAIENFEVEHWYDVLLDGPKRDEQMSGLKELLCTMGTLGIGVMGYNFSYATSGVGFPPPGRGEGLPHPDIATRWRRTRPRSLTAWCGIPSMIRTPPRARSAP